MKSMRIKPDEVVVGIPARQVRHLLRQSVDSLSARHAMKILEIEEGKAIEVLERLEHSGFLKRNPAPKSDQERSWRRTVKGGALANALFSNPVSRQSAEKAMSEFLDRVQQVNCDSWFLYRVQKVVVFGSFLSDSPVIGDLDLAVDLYPKEKDSRKHSKLIRARAEEAVNSGRSFRSYVEALQFAEQEVIMFLKARSRILQLARCDDGVLNITENRIIYENPEPIPAPPILPKRRLRRPKKIDEDCPF